MLYVDKNVTELVLGEYLLVYYSRQQKSLTGSASGLLPLRSTTTPAATALHAWVPPSPRVRCRQASFTYLLTSGSPRSRFDTIWLHVRPCCTAFAISRC